MSNTLRARIDQSTPITTSEWPSQPTRRQQMEVPTTQASPDFISRRLDDMLSTSFGPHIISYKLPKGFVVPKFTMYDGTNDSFDHIMHFRQLMTLDIRNDTLICKVFPTSLHSQTLSWFHSLPHNFVNIFRDVLEAFVGHYLCFPHQKQNISTLQNIKLQENETLRDFMKRFEQALLQVNPTVWTPYCISPSKTSAQTLHFSSFL